MVDHGLFAGGPHKSRQDIHLVGADPTGPTSSNNIIAEIRSSSNIVLKVDGPKAAQDGITFFISSNGVILTRGSDAILASKYIIGVIVCARSRTIRPGK